MLREITFDLNKLTEEDQKLALELLEKSRKTRARWRAEIGDVYFVFSSSGCHKETDRNYSEDDDNYTFGNYYRTMDEARFNKNKIQVLQELKDYALEHNEYEIDWSDGKQQKNYIIYNYYTDKFDVRFIFDERDLGQIYFTSEKIALDAIEKIGEDRIKKYLFEIE